jgi:hypothetical protein
MNIEKRGVGALKEGIPDKPTGDVLASQRAHLLGSLAEEIDKIDQEKFNEGKGKIRNYRENHPADLN